MKKSFFLAAIAIMALGIVSCKKSENPEPTNNRNPTNICYKVPEIDDMNAYLKDFKQKMQTRGNDDTMALDEAAWHLSCVANYDFGDVVSNYKNIHYDTLYYNINVENGRVSLSDLNALYTTASADIEDVFQNLNLENKHIHFIGANINGDGSVVMSILSTYDWINHQWYFPDPMTLYVTLSQYFDDDYTCDYDEFTDTLQSVLNLLTGFHNQSNDSYYFTEISYIDFIYSNYYDPYGPHNGNDYRIFKANLIPSIFDQDDLLYYCDSYAGLGIDNCPFNKHIINWNISKVTNNHHYPYTFYHLPRVHYGVITAHDPGPIH